MASAQWVWLIINLNVLIFTFIFIFFLFFHLIVDIFLGQSRSLSFNIQSHSTTPFRFEWKHHSDFTFIPAIGHLQPKQTKKIKVTFKSSEPKQHKGTILSCKLQKIRYTGQSVTDWDETFISTIPDEDLNDLSRLMRNKQPVAKESPNQKIKVNNLIIYNKLKTDCLNIFYL